MVKFAGEYLRTAADQTQAADEITQTAFEQRLPKGPTTGDVAMATLLYRAAEINLKLYDIHKGREQK